MRSRLLAVFALLPVALLATIGSAARAQSASMADGLVPGDYVRLGFGVTSPVNAQGSFRDWDRGKNANLVWENWQQGASGVGMVGFGLALDASLLPFNSSEFLGQFETTSGLRATSAHASDAKVLGLSTTIRVRIPAPFVMPSLQIGFGVLSFQPAGIDYVAPDGSGTTSQKHRLGGSLTLGGGLDKQIYDRAAIFGEAIYTYAFTSLGGQGVATAGGVCANGCDALKNTAVAVVRGGLRIRFSRE